MITSLLMQRSNVTIVSLILVLADSPVSAGDNSRSQFRGPAGNGTFLTARIPEEWSIEGNLAWSREIPGGGWSSPVVSKDRIFLTTAVSKTDVKPKGFRDGVASMRRFSRAKPPQSPYSFDVICLRLSDGKKLWQQTVVKRKPPYVIHPSNSYATESPATDGKRVYVYFAAVGIVASYDLDGKQVWKRDVGAFPTSNNFGTASSLTLGKGQVFLQCDNQKKSFFLALDCGSGRVLWKKDRPGETSWSSPVFWQNRKRSELVVCGSGEVVAHDPKTGRVLWNLTGLGGSFSASPAMDSDRIYFGNSGPASRGPLVAVNAGATGKLTLKPDQANVAWVERSSGPGMASPVAAGGFLYVVSRGIVACHNAKTGERYYRQRLGAISVAASLWIASGKLHVLDEAGTTYVLGLGPKFKLIGKNSIPGLFWSTPTVHSNSLLLRGTSKIYCIRKRVSSSPDK